MRHRTLATINTIACAIFAPTLLLYYVYYDSIIGLTGGHHRHSNSFNIFSQHKYFWRQQQFDANRRLTVQSLFRTPPLPTAEQSRDPNHENEKRRLFVKEMMKEAWGNYVNFAWGHNELKPLSKEPNRHSVFGEAKIGATLVDSMDTLLIMGMKQEFDQARQWLANSFDFKHTSNRVSVFETIIRFVGGLLSCYALTGDELFLNKSKEVAEALLPAYTTETGLPFGILVPNTSQTISQTSAVLSEMGSQHLEYIYLSDMTGDVRFRDKAFYIRNYLDRAEKPEGLYMVRMDSIKGQWNGRESSLGALGDSFFEYLIKSYVQSNYRDQAALRMYTEAMDAMERNEMIKVTSTGLMYIADWTDGQTYNKMQHLTCFAGGMFALGAHHMRIDTSKGGTKEEIKRIDRHFAIGANVTETCYQSYNRTLTKLGPESFYFDDYNDATNKNGDIYILRPEVIESYFVLWRLTHDNRYREYAWEATKALYRHCRTGNGYSGIYNVMANPSTKDDTQQSFFLAETLKYLYLIFSNDNLLSLDQWVFNTEAHPLPICGQNSAYPEELCNDVFY